MRTDRLPDRRGDAALDVADIRRAAAAGAGIIRETPVLSSRTLAERTGATVALKAENLQRTGSFKLRGALAKIASLGDAECARGVVTGSAGNHAQAVAYAARARGVPCEVFMPEAAPIAKVEAATSLGAEVQLIGATVDESLAAARERADRGGLAFVHPFDDPDVIAGQGGLGLELLAQVPDMTRVIVPVGGGGLVSGVAIAIKSQRPEVEVIGVQVDDLRSVPASLAAGEPVAVDSALTIADGIAVKRPGELTLALIERWVDGSWSSARTRSPRRWCSCSSGRSWSSRAPARSASRRCWPAASAGGGPGRRRSSCRAATSTPGLLARSPAGTRARPGGGWCCWRGCRTVPGRSRGCWRSSASRARTCSTSSTSARASTCTCARRRSSSCSRRAAREHAGAGRAGGARGRLRRAARDAVGARRVTSAPITRLRSSASGCHWTPSTNRRSGRLDRLGQLVERRVPVTIRPFADRVDALVVVGLGRRAAPRRRRAPRSEPAIEPTS